MADGNKTDQIPDELENLSPEELQERIQEEKKNAKRSLRFAFTALLAIVAVCIAWFVSNTRVTMTGTQISAENTVPFELASIGARQTVEQNKLIDDVKNSILSAGTTSSKYGECIDIYTGEKESLTDQSGKNPEFHIGTSGLAWYLNGQESLVPGSGGELEFYLIPKKSGLTSVKVKLNLTGYTEENGKAVELNNDKIQNLLKGHILFFQHLDDKYGYYGWLGEDQTIELNAPEINGIKNFQKDTPYKVTLHWKWPQYFRNYIYTDRSTQGDLFTDAIDKTESSEYAKLNTFINAQRMVSSSKLFYDTDDTAKIQNTINNTMNDETLNTCSKYYNQADEYIGKNASYVYIQIRVDSSN